MCIRTASLHPPEHHQNRVQLIGTTYDGAAPGMAVSMRPYTRISLPASDSSFRIMRPVQLLWRRPGSDRSKNREGPSIRGNTQTRTVPDHPELRVPMPRYFWGFQRHADRIRPARVRLYRFNSMDRELRRCHVVGDVDAALFPDEEGDVPASGKIIFWRVLHPDRSP